jgi:hypothetical protein
MKTFRCLLFAAMLLISSSALSLGGEIQFPGKSDPAPTPTPTALTTSTGDGVTQSASAEEIQIVWQDIAITMLTQVLLTIY